MKVRDLIRSSILVVVVAACGSNEGLQTDARLQDSGNALPDAPPNDDVSAPDAVPHPEAVQDTIADERRSYALADKRGGDLTIPIDAFAAELRALVRATQAQNDTSTSPFYERIATSEVALMGHSTGGAAIVLAAAAAAKDAGDGAPKALVMLAARSRPPNRTRDLTF